MEGNIKTELLETLKMFTHEQVEIPLSSDFKFRLRIAIDSWCDKWDMTRFNYSVYYNDLEGIVITTDNVTIKYALLGIMSIED